MSRPTRSVASPADPIGDGLRADAVAYWKMDEESGTRIDATESGHDLTSENAPASEIGIGGLRVAKLVSASKQYFHTDGTAFNNTTGSFEMCAWAMLPVSPDPGESYDILTLAKADPNHNLEYYSLFIPIFAANGSAFRFYIANDNFDSVDDPSGTPSVDTWYFVRAWFDSSDNTLHLNVNNGNDISAPLTATKPTIASPGLFVGASQPNLSGAAPYWNGDIGLVGYWNRLLTVDERDYLYNSGAGRSLY